MSTRCQTKVIEGQKDSTEQFNEDITLYHHCDGYPEWMVPLFYKAYLFGITPFVPEWKKDEPNPVPTDACQWQAFRGGYAASMLCHIDPRGFQPEKPLEINTSIIISPKLSQSLQL